MILGLYDLRKSATNRSTFGRQKVWKTLPKSASYTLGKQKRPKMLPKGSGASLKLLIPKN